MPAGPALLLAAAAIALWAMPNGRSAKAPTRFARLIAEVRRGVPEISPKELHARLGRVGATPRVIDIREEVEWRNGRIPSSEHIARGILEMITGPPRPPGAGAEESAASTVRASSTASAG